MPLNANSSRIRHAVLCIAVCSSLVGFAGSSWDADRLSSCRKSIAAGKGKQVLSRLDRLTKSDTDVIAREAAYLYADVSLSLDPQENVRKAEDLLGNLAARGTDDEWRTKAAIRLAQHWDNTAQQEAACKLLDRILAENRQTIDDIRIAAALGDLYASHDAWNDAIRAYEYAVKLPRTLKLSDLDGIDLKHIQRLLEDAKKQLARPDKKEPETTFGAAEKLRQATKYAQATPLYRKVYTDFPDHSLAAPAELRHGQCLLLDGKVDNAEKALQSFIKKKPFGAYRGHAHLLIGDILLEHRFEIDEASRTYSIVLKADADKVDKTWTQILADIHDRLGLIEYFSGNTEAAAKHFEASVRLRPTKTYGDVPGQGMACLVEMCRADKLPMPKFLLKQGRKKVRFVLFLASAYMEGWKDKRSLHLFERVSSGDLKEAAGFEQQAYAALGVAGGYAHLNENEKALACYARFEKKPYSRSHFAPDALLQTACLHGRQARTDKSHEYLARVYREYPRSEWAPWAMFQHAFSLWVLKRDEEALRLFRKFKADYPKYDRRRRESADRFIDGLKKRIAQNKKLERDKTKPPGRRER